MKIRMLITKSGSPDGIQVNEYQVGQKYDLPQRLAEIFLGAGWAEEDKAFDQAPEIKIEAEPVVKKKKRSRKA